MTDTAVLEAPPPISPGQLDHLSWSGIKTYQTCPKKFEFKYLDQAPEEFKASSLLFGGAFHSAVESICEARLRGLPVPEIEAILAAYDAAWQRETAAAPQIQFCKDEDEATLRELASRMLSVYREYAITESTMSEPSTIVGIEESKRFRLLAEVPPIESRIDLIELHGKDLIVSDLKTSRSRWNDEKVREATPQLILYANSLVPLMRSLNAERIVPRFVIVTKAKRAPAVQVLEPKATQDDVGRLREMVGETWAAIQTGLFVRRESWACGQCPFKNRCLGR